MCFSPEASFGSGVLLSVVAVATLRKAALNDRSMLGFAMFPAIFGAHQLIEGMVWITMDDNAKGMLWRYLYFSIATLCWPMLTPYASWMAERQPFRRQIFLTFFAMGCCLTAYLTWKLAIEYTSIDVPKVCHSLSYVCQPLSAHPPFWIDYIYAAVTVIPLLGSSRPHIQRFGIGVLVAFGVTFSLLHSVYFSTWCMASAILSAIIYFAIGTPKEQADVPAGETRLAATAPPI